MGRLAGRGVFILCGSLRASACARGDCLEKKAEGRGEVSQNGRSDARKTAARRSLHLRLGIVDFRSWLLPEIQVVALHCFGSTFPADCRC